MTLKACAAALPLATAMATTVASCTAERRSGPDRASTLTILADPGDYRLVTPVTGLYMNLVYSALFGPSDGSEDVPGLVRAWEHTGDFREWTYHLRTDVRWHDGVPLTAHDVKFTYDLLNHQAVLRDNPKAHTVTVLDDSTFTVLLHRRTGGELPLDDYNAILPRHLLGDLDPDEFSEWEAWAHPVGTGPYRFVGYEPRTGIELEANPDYFLGKPEIDRIVLKLGGTPWADLESGAVDVVTTDATAFRQAADPRFRGYWRAGRNVGIVWNHANPLFQDVRVRRALTYSIDRGTMKVATEYPPEFPLVDFPATFRQMLKGDFPAPYPFDPELARGLLEEAGWQDQDGDGVLERAGVKFRFTLLTDASFENMAVFVKDQLSRVGIAAEIELTALAVVRNRFQEGDFDGMLGRTDVSILLSGSAELPGSGYHSAELERILAERDASFDPSADEDAYRAMWPIFRDEHPVTPLIPLPRWSIANVRVKGLRSPGRVFPRAWAAQLWLEEGR